MARKNKRQNQPPSSTNKNPLSVSDHLLLDKNRVVSGKSVPHKSIPGKQQKWSGNKMLKNGDDLFSGEADEELDEESDEDDDEEEYVEGPVRNQKRKSALVKLGNKQKRTGPKKVTKRKRAYSFSSNSTATLSEATMTQQGLKRRMVDDEDDVPVPRKRVNFVNTVEMFSSDEDIMFDAAFHENHTDSDSVDFSDGDMYDDSKMLDDVSSLSSLDDSEIDAVLQQSAGFDSEGDTDGEDGDFEDDASIFEEEEEFLLRRKPKSVSFSLNVPEDHISEDGVPAFPATNSGHYSPSVLTSDEDEVEDTPWYEERDAAVQHVISTSQVGCWPESDDDVHGEWEFAFASEEDEEEMEDSETSSDSETDDDVTDLDEEPDSYATASESPSASRQSSFSSPTRPQIINRATLCVDNGPRVGSWIADPSRPIAFIDRYKKTRILSPAALGLDAGDQVTSPRFSISESDFDGSIMQNSGQWCVDLGDILSAGSPSRNNDVASHGSPCFHDGEHEYSASEDYLEGSSDEIEDPTEQFLDSLIQFDDTSDDEHDASDEHDENEDGDKTTPRRPSNASSNNAITPNNMLDRFNNVSVTSFRQRQAQHQLQNAADPRLFDPYTNDGEGVMKAGRHSKLNSAITPVRRRKHPIAPVSSPVQARRDQMVPNANLIPLEPLFSV